ncbi:MAG: restriction endonuclease subunit S [Anaerovoracaceae bacterium]
MVTYPKDWEVVELGTKCDITSSKRVFEKEWAKTGVPFFRTRDIANLHSNEEQRDKLFISEQTYIKKIESSGEPRKGDILVTGVGTIGLPYLIDTDKRMYFKDGNILWLKKSNAYNPKYLYLLFLSTEVEKQIADKSGFTTVGTFTIKNAKKLMTPLPPLPEQQAIASVLTDVDEHIDNLTELIEKKKAIRDGALVDLVSGKTRLDGFNGEWEVVSFSQMITPKARIGWQGLKKSEYLMSGNSYLIGGTDFSNGTISFEHISYVSKERFDMDSNIQVSETDVLVTKDGTIGKIAIIPKLDKPATLNSGVFVFRTTKKLESSFLYRVLSSTLFREFIDTLSAGSTIKHLYQKDLKIFEFKIPVDIKEQQAIASVLTAMDEEIQSLETEKAKMIEIKEGAMDDLLTGRVRLKI